MLLIPIHIALKSLNNKIVNISDDVIVQIPLIIDLVEEQKVRIVYFDSTKSIWESSNLLVNVNPDGKSISISINGILENANVVFQKPTPFGIAEALVVLAIEIAVSDLLVDTSIEELSNFDDPSSYKKNCSSKNPKKTKIILKYPIVSSGNHDRLKEWWQCEQTGTKSDEDLFRYSATIPGCKKGKFIINFSKYEAKIDVTNLISRKLYSAKVIYYDDNSATFIYGACSKNECTGDCKSTGSTGS